MGVYGHPLLDIGQYWAWQVASATATASHNPFESITQAQFPTCMLGKNG